MGSLIRISCAFSLFLCFVTLSGVSGDEDESDLSSSESRYGQKLNNNNNNNNKRLPKEDLAHHEVEVEFVLPSSTQLPVLRKTKLGRMPSKIMVRTFRTTTPEPEPVSTVSSMHQNEDNQHEGDILQSSEDEESNIKSTADFLRFYNNPYAAYKLIPSSPTKKKIYQDEKKKVYHPTTTTSTTTTTTEEIPREDPQNFLHEEPRKISYVATTTTEAETVEPPLIRYHTSGPVTPPIPKIYGQSPSQSYYTERPVGHRHKERKQFVLYRTRTSINLDKKVPEIPSGLFTLPTQGTSTEQTVSAFEDSTNFPTQTTNYNYNEESAEESKFTTNLPQDETNVDVEQAKTTVLPPQISYEAEPHVVVPNTTKSPSSSNIKYIRVITRTSKPVYRLIDDEDVSSSTTTTTTTTSTTTTPSTTTESDANTESPTTVEPAINENESSSPSNSTEEGEKMVEEIAEVVTELPDPFPNHKTIEIPPSAIQEPNYANYPAFEVVPSVQNSDHGRAYAKFYRPLPLIAPSQQQRSFSQYSHNKFIDIQKSEEVLVPLRTVVSYEDTRNKYENELALTLRDSLPPPVPLNYPEENFNNSPSFVPSKTLLYYTSVSPAVFGHKGSSSSSSSSLAGGSYLNSLLRPPGREINEFHSRTREGEEQEQRGGGFLIRSQRQEFPSHRDGGRTNGDEGSGLRTLPFFVDYVKRNK